MKKAKQIIELIIKLRKYGKYINAIIDIFTYAQLRISEVENEKDSLTYKDVNNVGENNAA